MGLDMHAYKTKFTPASEVDFRVSEEQKIEELYSWHKHHNLHGWMKELYRDKGGKENFNCVNVLLREEDLSDLKSEIVRKQPPSTTGAFLGQSYNSEEEKAHDLTFIMLAQQALDEGYTVYYTSHLEIKI